MDIEYLLCLPPHELEMRLLNLSHRGLTFKLIEECTVVLMYNNVAFDNDIPEDSTAGDFEELNYLFAEADRELEC